jgi:hypothetical protein
VSLIINFPLQKYERFQEIENGADLFLGGLKGHILAKAELRFVTAGQRPAEGSIPPSQPPPETQFGLSQRRDNDGQVPPFGRGQGRDVYPQVVDLRLRKLGLSGRGLD